MNLDPDVLIRASLLGIGGTITLDVWAQLVQRTFGWPATNWAMVGRWLGHMRKGKFVHEAIAKAAPVRGELGIGWLFHYAIGIGYGVLLVAICDAEWLQRPTVMPPVLLALALLIAPYFVMMPGLGAGVAGSKTPRPNLMRLKSVLGHTAFGLGMYATALALAA